MTAPLRSWKERIRGGVVTADDPRDVLPNRAALEDVNIDMQRVAAAIVGLDPDALDNEPRDPTQEEIDAWLIPADWDEQPPGAPGHRWQAWGPLCLVCHRDVPEGHAVAYPFLIGSRACLGDCATYLDSLLRVYDRSARGRWRPTRQVHTLANGASCRTCERGAA